MSFIWHNGHIRDDGPVFTAHDRMRLGECVFNTMLAIDGKMVHAALHFEKLLKNSSVLFGEWTTPAMGTLEAAAHELLHKNKFTKGRYAVNTIITRGASGNGLKTPEKPDMQIVMRALPVAGEFAPLHAVTAQNVRRNEGSPLSRIKCANYGENIIALREAEEKGANEAILLNNAGNVACATTANIAVILNGALVTPPMADGAQGGVTRALLMKKFPVTEQSITPAQLKNAQGIYLLNSLRGAAALLSLDGQTLASPIITIDKDFHLQ